MRVALVLLLATVLVASSVASAALVGAQSGRHKSPPPASPAPRRPTPPSGGRPRTIGDTTPTTEPPATPTPVSVPPSTTGTTTGTTTSTSTPAQASPSPSGTGNNSSNSSSSDDVVEDDEVVRVNSNLVPVPATVIDAQGKAVTNLELKDFELRVDGELKPIGEISRSATPVRMAVLFDNSQSMAPAREFEKLAAIRFFRRVMRPIDQASLYAVSTEPTLVRPLTNDVPALVRAVERFPNPEGATSLFDGIVQATEYLRPHPGRKVIILVSDGVETTSQIESFDEVLRRMLAADCQFFAVQTGHSDNANLRNLVAERRLQEFAAQTGGAVYAPKSIPDLDVAFSHVAADLAEQYVLSYYPVNERRDGRFHIFSLRVVTRPDMRVRTRKGYYAPKG